MNTEDKFTYRITYTKGEKVKYISHLDFLRCMNRSFKRAKLPVKYSKGFNPHILLNIALPCPVGVESECELLDISLYEKMSEDTVQKALSEAMPDGIRILKAEENTDSEDFSNISLARYTAKFKTDKKTDLSPFLQSDEILIEKKSKRGVKTVNIKDFIKSFDVVLSDGLNHEISFIADAGNKSNLKPSLVIGAIENSCKVHAENTKIKRCEIFFGKDI